MADVNGSDHEEALHGLFSMVASDNAEVIPQDAPRGPETMWSVAANAGEDAPDAGTTNGSVPWSPVSNGAGRDAERPADASTAGSGGGSDDVWMTTDDAADTTRPRTSGGAFSTGPTVEHDEDDASPPPFNGWEDPGPTWNTASSPFRRAPADPTGSIFSAEPIEHADDVVDEAEFVDDPWTSAPPAAEGSLFSNGAHLSHGPDGRRRTTVSEPRGPVSDDPWVITDRRWDDSGVDWWDQASRSAAPGGASDGPGPAWSPSWSETAAGPGPEPVELDDPQGYETAILRLHPQDRERAHVPLSVCGALLHEDELVLGVVTGQMLGRPAAVVVTEGRVLVVNDRRWQPVVDIFPIDADLVVRGRHDRHVAALSFADPTRVSMVDGISEVLIAIELAGHIRDAGTRGAAAPEPVEPDPYDE